ncbi:hypothetical protein ACOSQ3_011794 [Xanthoceras sorbifolium]
MQAFFILVYLSIYFLIISYSFIFLLLLLPSTIHKRLLEKLSLFQPVNAYVAFLLENVCGCEAAKDSMSPRHPHILLGCVYTNRPFLCNMDEIELWIRGK